jgi:hypothetical protein
VRKGLERKERVKRRVRGVYEVEEKCRLSVKGKVKEGRVTGRGRQANL